MNAISSIPAPGAVQYRYAYATDRGLVREQNEDAIAIAEEAGLALVADGMGGYNAGEVASGLAAEFLVTHLIDDLAQLNAGGAPGDFPARAEESAGDAARRATRVLHALLRARIDGANEAIIDLANREPECLGMGTTLAMLLFSHDAVTTLHLGDSRIYRMRDDVLSLLTRDHSLLQEQLDAGVITPEEARGSINRNFVTRALGVDLVADPEIGEYDMVPGDLYLICSDGLPDMLSDEEIFDLLRGDGGEGALEGELDGPPSGAPGDDAGRWSLSDGRVATGEALDDIATRLVVAANARGGRDNVSVVLASVGWPRDAVAQQEQDEDAPEHDVGSDRRNRRIR